MNTSKGTAPAQRRPMGGGPMGHGPMMAKAEKPRDFKGTMLRLSRYLGSYKVLMVIVMYSHRFYSLHDRRPKDIR
jgi:ATP-binding cassette subfamily B protein